MGALSVTGQEKYQADYQPLVPDTILLDFNDIQQLEHAFSHRVCGGFWNPSRGRRDRGGGFGLSQKSKGTL